MFSEGWLQRVIGVCPQMNENMRVVKTNFIGKLSEKLCWEIFQQFKSERPMNCFRESSNKFTSEDCQTYLYQRVAHE